MPAKRKLFYETGHVRSYAIRRVNPFLGVLQIIETVDGRASSTNGVVWDIEVRSEVAGGWGSLNQSSRQVAYYRFGLWSLESGLISRPLVSQHRGGPLFRQCESLIECVHERYDQVPFRLIDNRELWLYDSNDEQPVVLLASVTANDRLPTPEPRYWASCIGVDGIESQRRFPRSRELEAMVRQRAGFNINKHWISRQEDGSGVDERVGTSIPAQLFPTYLLTLEWQESWQVELVHEYIDWISPSLLTLQQLNQSERIQLECAMEIQARSIEYHWQLYPQVIDKGRLDAARVKSRLQQANKDIQEVS